VTAIETSVRGTLRDPPPPPLRPAVDYVFKPASGPHHLAVGALYVPSLGLGQEFFSTLWTAKVDTGSHKPSGDLESG
jgi:hypothetical protein